jgi:hypothetical protein
LDATQAVTGNLVPTHDPDDPLLFQIIYDGQHQEIILHEQFQHVVQHVIGGEGLTVRAQEVLSANQSLQGRFDESMMDFLRIDYTLQMVLGIYNRQDRVRSGIQPVEHQVERIGGMEYGCGPLG